MPDDIDMSAEQNEEEVMTEDEQEALFNEDETKADTDVDDFDDNEDDGDEAEEDEDADDQDDDVEDPDDSDEDDDDDDSDDQDDDDPLADLKARAAKLKEDEAAAAKAEEEKAAQSEAMKAAKDELLKEIFGAETVKVGDHEVNLQELREDYGEELDTLITARAYQIVEPLMAKVMENGKYASQDDIKAIKEENENFRFMSQVAQSHPDVWKLNGDQKFWDWVDAQGDATKVLMEKGGVDGTSAVISAYKKATISATNEKLDKKSGDKKKKHTDLHKSTIRSKRSKRASSGKKDGNLNAEEEAKLFNEIEVED